MVSLEPFHEVRSDRVSDDLLIEESEKRSGKAFQTLQALLLVAPTLTANEANEYEKVREWMVEWHVTDSS